MSVQSIAVPYARDAPTTCGYCSPPGERSQEAASYKIAALHALRLSCEVYQRMIDVGWRRSGTYCYKPDLRRSCCPQYTIKLDALAFKTGKNHRKLVHRWNRYVIHGEGDSDAMNVKAGRPKGKDNAPFNLTEALHAPELENIKDRTPSHAFEVTLELASYTQEKFDLYCKYQRDIHNDHDNTPSGFKRFLVESPLMEEPIPYSSSPPEHLPKTYGSYHQLYRVDGQLIAMAVLDILPSCVSSVYFMYDSLLEHFSFGKLSAMREVTLAKEIHDAGVTNVKYLYLGFYVHSCRKMRYKGEYSPSYLADPETYEWYPLERCIPLLEKNRYACFSDPSHCIEGDAPKLPGTPEVPLDKLDELYVLKQKQGGGFIAVPIAGTNYWDLKSVKNDFCSCIEGLGLDLAESIIWTV